jgi:hypothetical protein
MRFEPSTAVSRVRNSNDHSATTPHKGNNDERTARAIIAKVMMSAYFCDFLTSAAAAAEPAWMLLAWTYDAAYVSGQVASQARDRPLFQGTCYYYYIRP